MPRIETGNSTTGQANVNANFSLATYCTPLVGSHYSAGFETTSLAFTNNVVVWDFRNPTANLVLISKLNAKVFPMALAAGAAGGLRAALQLFVGRSYTALSNTGRTAQTLSTNNAKLRTSYSTPGVEIGFASATGGITTGTVTEDATPLATTSDSVMREVLAPVANQNQRYPTNQPLDWQAEPIGGPIVLAQNEGIRLRYLVTTAAAAVVAGYVRWTELGSTTFP